MPLQEHHQCADTSEDQEEETAERDRDAPDHAVRPDLGRGHEREHAGAREHRAEDQEHEPAKAPTPGREVERQCPTISVHTNDPGRQNRDIRRGGLRQSRLTRFQRRVQEKRRDPVGTANALSKLGVTRYELGELAKALRLQERALELNEEIGGWYRISRSLMLIGNVYHAMGDFHRSIEYLERALVVYEREF